MSLDKAAQAIQVNLFREGLLAHSTPWNTLSPATQRAWLSAVETALPHLEAHFREQMAQRLEAKADKRDWPESESYPDHTLSSAFRDAALFLRESDR